MADVFSGGILLNSNNDNSGDITIQFGQSLGQTFKWNNTTLNFELSDDLDLQNNQLLQFRAENVSALPGGAAGLGVSNAGRIVELTGTDSVAPGCSSPSCTPGSYSWNGGTWVPMQGGSTATTLTKIVTVGPTGRDYTSIAAAAAYLNTLSGGEIWVDPGTYPVITAVDLRNIRIIGVGSNETILAVSGSGVMEVKDTLFDKVRISVDSGISAASALNVAYDAGSTSSVFFNLCDFVINGSKVLIDSTATTAPTLLAYFQNSSESAGTGKIVKSTSTANLNVATSKLTVVNLFSDKALEVGDWDVTIIGGSNVVTSGTIITVPDRTILVSPGMNIQGAVDSLGANGGVVKLLVGTHDVTQSINILQNNIEIEGEGPGTILRAQAGTWTGGTTTDDALINVGATNGTSPRNSVVVNNFTMEIGPNIHGIQVNGGMDIKVMDMVIESIGTKSGSPNMRVGLLFTNGATTAASRFLATNNIITTDVPADRWSEGIHLDGDTSLGSYGYANGFDISDSIVSDNIVNEARETCYSFTNVSASSIFSNRARNIGYTSSALGLFLNNLTDGIVMNNTMEGANAAATGIDLYHNVINTIIVGNAVRGGPVNYSVGIKNTDSSNVGNIISSNQFSNVDTRMNVSGSTATKLEVLHTRSTSDPTINDDINDGYEVGTIWVNTNSGNSYLLVNSTVGAAVWQQITGGSLGILTGTPSNTFTLDNDNTGGNVSLQFGAALGQSLTWNSSQTRFDLSNALNIMGKLSLQSANLTLSNGANNNVNLSSINSSVIRVTGPTSSFNISGFSGGVDGRLLYLINTTSQPMTINDQSTSSTASNRIITGKSADISDNGNSTITLIYDGGSSRWRVINSLGTATSPSGNGTYNASNGYNNNISIPSNDNILISGPSYYFVITGISGGVDGRTVTLINTTNATMYIQDNSGNSSGSNRIITNTGNTISTSGTGSVTLVYDGSASRWRVIDFSP